jgi:hypothetical protein
MMDTLKCFVSGRHLPGDSQHGVVSFAVPEYGILFRSLAKGGRADLEIIAFLSFLRFAEHNIEIFKRKQLNIFTDFPILAFIVNDESRSIPGVEAVRQEAAKKAKVLRFEVVLIDTESNRAAGSADDIPVMPIGSSLKIRTFASLAANKNITDQSDRLKA